MALNSFRKLSRVNILLRAKLPTRLTLLSSIIVHCYECSIIHIGPKCHLEESKIGLI